MHVRTAAEAIVVLGGGDVLEISFDHDLGEEQAGTGYDVAAWIEEQSAAGPFQAIKWAVHSANPVGRAKVEAAMRSAERFWASTQDHR